MRGRQSETERERERERESEREDNNDKGGIEKVGDRDRI